ncbi:MAG: hypothetical protein ACTSQE_13610 [Candidatus Heimdallarchaeaceae archaeon]
MLHKGNREISSDLPNEIQSSLMLVLDEFVNLVEEFSQKRSLKRAMVRSRFPCSIVVVITSDSVFIIGQKHFGLPFSKFFYRPTISISGEQIFNDIIWEFGFTDPFMITLPSSIFHIEQKQRNLILSSVAQQHIESEVQRVMRLTNLIQIKPIFGPIDVKLQENFVFVLMPFKEDLTEIYENIVKPTVESLNLICRKADDLKTNNVIILDIWKAICESRLIIADLTELNPNVMYELGIAHTVGKETILIYQKPEERQRFPFDITHIRRIEYENTASGGKKLEKDLRKTIQNILEPQTIS